MHKDNILIIGGGASALMLASLLPRHTVTILESNTTTGAKIAISGGGKCNITNNNMDTQYYLGDPDFISASLTMFNEKSLLRWLKKRNLIPVLRKETQYFCKNSSKELLDVFTKASQKQHIILNEKVLSVIKRDGTFFVKTHRHQYRAKIVVVASGGLSFPKIGASDIGYKIARHFGHSIVKTAPALVGFTVQKEQFFFKTLSGISTEVCIRTGDRQTKGSLLFTHKGISGPAVLNASLYWERGEIEINFLPHFSWEHLKGSHKHLSSLLPLPKRFTKAFLIQLGIEDKPYYKVTQKERTQLQSLHTYRFSPAGTFGYTKAEVTKGGVETSEIESSSMMSKKEDNLYFIGEVLNVTGALGGYNFQWAFSSAFACAQEIKGKL